MASITETKNRLSALLDRVRRGESILIVDRGRPVARLEPVIGDDPDERDGRLARLERQGIVRRARSGPLRKLVGTPPPRPRGSGDILEALLSERREGR